MSRIDSRFAALAEQGRKGLIPFLTAGDPSRELTVPLMHALVQGGADVIELGVPFSDPMADGPVIQRSSERALARGVTLRDCLAWVREFRANDATTPVVLMGYANPIERYGVPAFVEDAAAAGVDGLLVVDYPPEECEAFAQALQAKNLAPIFLLAPTSQDRRIEQAARVGAGYLYYVSLTGVTGVQSADPTKVLGDLPRVRARTKLPIGVGFGIKDGPTAKAISAHADAVIIGSQLVKTLEAAGDQAVDAARSFMAEIRAALDA